MSGWCGQEVASDARGCDLRDLGIENEGDYIRVINGLQIEETSRR